MKSFILVSFSFPPYEAVASNRWSNLVEEMAKLGHEIHVVTVNWMFQSNDYLIKNLPSNVFIHRIGSGAPHSLKFANFNFKVLNYLRDFVFKYFIDKFLYPFDIAQKWEKKLVQKISEIKNEKDIKVVVVTGGPFSPNYFLSKMKKQNNDFFLIHDFRDIWLQNPYKKLNFSHKKVLTRQLTTTLEYCDRVVLVSDGLRPFFKCPEDKLTIIPNGYNEEKINNVINSFRNTTPNFKDERIVITHIGNVTNGRQVPLLKLLEVIENSNLNINKILIHLIGHTSKPLHLLIRSKFKKLNENNVIKFTERLDQESAFLEILKSDVALLLNSSHKNFAYSLPTKMYEYFKIGKFVLSLNYGGEVADFIEKNEMGLSVNLMEKDLFQELPLFLKTDFQKFKISKDASEFSNKNLALRYSNLINNL